MAINIFTVKKVQCINKVPNENQELIEVEPNDDSSIISTSIIRELTGDDTISLREYYDNQHLYSSFEEFIKIELGIDTDE